MAKKILVVDYKTGNLDSIIKAISVLGYDPIFSSDKEDLNRSNKILLPGQGSYNKSIENLKKTNLFENLLTKIDKENIPILGICVGMQILSTTGEENSISKGLDLIKGHVKKMKTKPYKLPHIGWNTVNLKKNKIFKDLDNKKDFYFIHSFYFKCEDKTNVIATTKYNQEFASIINRENIYGFQFHPEKSLTNGLKLLKNFLDLK